MDNFSPQLNKKFRKLALLAAVLLLVFFGLKFGAQTFAASQTDNIFSNVMTNTFGKALNAPEKFDHTLAGADYQSVFNKLVRPGIFPIIKILENAKNKLLNIFAPQKSTPIIIEVSRTPKTQTATSTTAIITQIVNSNQVREVINRELRETVKREIQVVEKVKTIETKEIVYRDAPAAQTPAVSAAPSQFLQNNLRLANDPGKYLLGDNAFGGTISFDKGTIIDFTGVHVFNWPISPSNTISGGSSEIGR